MKHLLFTIAIILAWQTLCGQTKGYQAETHHSSNSTALPYQYLEPEQTLKGQTYPLVIFLHGSGERGCDNQKQLTHGGQMFLNPSNREKYASYVLIPQCPEDKTWKSEDVSETLLSLINKYLALPQIDKRRVYIIGLSMGAYGIYDLVPKHHEIFAAAAPICGQCDTTTIAKAKNVAFAIYHGDNDLVVPVEGSRAAYRTLRNAGAKRLKYTEFAGVTHGSWNPAFNTPDFFKWIYSQRLRK